MRDSLGVTAQGPLEVRDPLSVTPHGAPAVRDSLTVTRGGHRRCRTAQMPPPARLALPRVLQTAPWDASHAARLLTGWVQRVRHGAGRVNGQFWERGTPWAPPAVAVGHPSTPGHPPGVTGSKARTPGGPPAVAVGAAATVAGGAGVMLRTPVTMPRGPTVTSSTRATVPGAQKRALDSQAPCRTGQW